MTMDNILQQIGQMQEGYDKLNKLNDEYLKMFELAGFSLYTEEDEDGKSRPKEIKELLAEALGNPPSDDPACWIRISDIPRYVSDFLIVAKGVDLEDFNEEAKTSLAPRKNRAATNDHVNDHDHDDEDQEPEPEPGTEEDLVRYVAPGLMDGLRFSGREWQKAGQVPSEVSILDSLGVMWHKKAKNHWVEVEENPTYEPFTDADVTTGAPLKEVVPD